MDPFTDVAARIRAAEIGGNAWLRTPFGPRLLHYADFTATGRALEFVERFIERVRPWYANTHTAVSTTGRIMNGLREEARALIERSVRAGPEDVVLFTGSGATAAVNKLVGLLGIRIPEPLEREFQLSRAVPPHRRPLVVVGPYEHHSNQLPWLESIADVVEVGLDAAGGIDMADLRAKLREGAGRPLIIGSFSAASNVTGLLTDVRLVARTLHAAGALVCMDYAAAGPYVPIDMHPPDPAERLDAIFLSGHKFVGGPEASGVLVAHRDLFRSRTPERPGGGTVDYVAACRHDKVDYVPRLAEREEGGTPSILGDVRAGLAFLVKEMLGPERILEHETRIAGWAIARLARHPRVRILGSLDAPRLAILSFNVQGLHHDLVSALLDHLFGIQNRAGCSCAGPYGHRLLGVDRDRSERFRRLIAEGVLGAKPGWVRLSVPCYATDADLEYLLRAVEFVADRGDAFVPDYRLSWRDGVWRHVEREVTHPSPLGLTAAELLSRTEAPRAPLSEAELSAERARVLAEAERIAAELEARAQAAPPRWNAPTGRADLDELVWFRYVETEGL